MCFRAVARRCYDEVCSHRMKACSMLGVRSESSALGLCLYLQSPHAAGFDQKQGLRRASALWLSPRQTYAALSLVPAMDILGVFPAAILEGPWFVPRTGPAGFPHPGSRTSFTYRTSSSMSSLQPRITCGRLHFSNTLSTGYDASQGCALACLKMSVRSFDSQFSGSNRRTRHSLSFVSFVLSL